MKFALAVLCVFATSTLYVLAKPPKTLTKYVERDDEIMKKCRQTCDFTDEDEKKLDQEGDPTEEEAIEIFKKLNCVFECGMQEGGLVNDKNELQPAKIHEMLDAESKDGTASAAAHEKIDECIEQVSNSSKEGYAFHFTMCCAEKLDEFED